jgi:hypothetical protein
VHMESTKCQGDKPHFLKFAAGTKYEYCISRQGI